MVLLKSYGVVERKGLLSQKSLKEKVTNDSLKLSLSVTMTMTIAPYDYDVKARFTAPYDTYDSEGSIYSTT
jgi:hypothetical protein